MKSVLNIWSRYVMLNITFLFLIYANCVTFLDIVYPFKPGLTDVLGCQDWDVHWVWGKNPYPPKLFGSGLGRKIVHHWLHHSYKCSQPGMALPPPCNLDSGRSSRCLGYTVEDPAFRMSGFGRIHCTLHWFKNYMQPRKNMYMILYHNVIYP